MALSIIAAIDHGGLIGAGGRLPWRLPADLARFRKLTMGKPCVMGRKTFESLPGPLDGRHMVVLSQTSAGLTHGQLARSFYEALSMAVVFGPEVMVIGGAEVYARALPLADQIYLTTVHTTVQGMPDAPRFPRLNWNEWQQYDHEFCAADEHDSHAHSFVRLVRHAKQG